MLATPLRTQNTRTDLAAPARLLARQQVRSLRATGLSARDEFCGTDFLVMQARPIREVTTIGYSQRITRDVDRTRTI
jgi:hypothetical protein